MPLRAHIVREDAKQLTCFFQRNTEKKILAESYIQKKTYQYQVAVVAEYAL